MQLRVYFNYSIRAFIIDVYISYMTRFLTNALCCSLRDKDLVEKNDLLRFIKVLLKMLSKNVCVLWLNFYPFHLSLSPFVIKVQ